jgi:hypothetical protein
MIVWGMDCRFPVAFVLTSLLGCGATDDTETTVDTGVQTGLASADESEGASDGDGTESTESTETTGPAGEEYGDCQDVFDCPEGTLYVCLSKVSEGHVCAPSCDEHADCPPPPPGGSTTPACTTVDDRKRCLMAGCQADEDCPAGMVCHIEGPNWCHWPV